MRFIPQRQLEARFSRITVAEAVALGGQSPIVGSTDSVIVFQDGRTLLMCAELTGFAGSDVTPANLDAALRPVLCVSVALAKDAARRLGLDVTFPPPKVV